MSAEGGATGDRVESIQDESFKEMEEPGSGEPEKGGNAEGADTPSSIKTAAEAKTGDTQTPELMGETIVGNDTHDSGDIPSNEGTGDVETEVAKSEQSPTETVAAESEVNTTTVDKQNDLPVPDEQPNTQTKHETQPCQEIDNSVSDGTAEATSGTPASDEDKPSLVEEKAGGDDTPSSVQTAADGKTSDTQTTDIGDSPLNQGKDNAETEVTKVPDDANANTVNAEKDGQVSDEQSNTQIQDETDGTIEASSGPKLVSPATDEKKQRVDEVTDKKESTRTETEDETKHTPDTNETSNGEPEHIGVPGDLRETKEDAENKNHETSQEEMLETTKLPITIGTSADQQTDNANMIDDNNLDGDEQPTDVKSVDDGEAATQDQIEEKYKVKSDEGPGQTVEDTHEDIKEEDVSKPAKVEMTESESGKTEKEEETKQTNLPHTEREKQADHLKVEDADQTIKERTEAKEDDKILQGDTNQVSEAKNNIDGQNTVEEVNTEQGSVTDERSVADLQKGNNEKMDGGKAEDDSQNTENIKEDKETSNESGDKEQGDKVDGSKFEKAETDENKAHPTPEAKKPEDTGELVGEEQSSNRSLFLGAILIVIVLLGYKLVPSAKESDAVELESSDGCQFTKRLDRSDLLTKGIKSLRNQYPMFEASVWDVVAGASWTHVYGEQEPTRPVVLLLVGQPGKADANRVGDRVADMYARLYKKQNGNPEVIRVNGASLEAKSSDSAKLAMDRQIKDGFEGCSRVALVTDLDKLPACSAILFHGYCDNSNAPLKDAVIVFTMTMTTELAKGASGQEIERNVLDQLQNRWSECPEEFAPDKIVAMQSRVANNIVILQ